MFILLTALKNKLFKTQIQRIALLALPYPLIVTLMSIDRLYDDTQSLGLPFCLYLAATIFAGVMAFTNLGEMLEQYLKQLNQRKSK